MRRLKGLNRLNKSKTLSVALAVGLVITNLVTVVPTYAAGSANSSIMAVHSSRISVSSSTFDKNKPKTITVRMTLNGNTLEEIQNGTEALNPDTDYTVVDENIVTINEEYLSTLNVGSTRLKFHYSAGVDRSLSITIRDSTPSSRISSSSGRFDLYVPKNVAVKVSPARDTTLDKIMNGEEKLALGDDYTVSEDQKTVTITKEYLSKQEQGTIKLNFDFSAGKDSGYSVVVRDSTPSSRIFSSSGRFDLYVPKNVVVKVSPARDTTLDKILNGEEQLVLGDDYTVSEDQKTVTITKEYLSKQEQGTIKLNFDFSAGKDSVYSVVMNDSSPASRLGSKSARFDNDNPIDVVVKVIPAHSNTLEGITNDGVPLMAADHTVSEDQKTVTISKDYLGKLENGTTTLKFDFSAGSDRLFNITVRNFKPAELDSISAVSGTPKVGVELTAGALTPAGATVNYQWQICATSVGVYADIAGATTNKYTPVASDVTKFIKVVVTGTGSYSGTVISVATGAIDKEDGQALAGVTIDDTSNTISGMTAAMEFSTNGTEWTAYNIEIPNLPDLTGTVALQVRVAATATREAGIVTTFNFTLVGTVPVNLGMAGNYAILAKSGISSVPNSVITGDIGVSPANATAITGFSLSQDATNEFSTSAQITGKVYAPGYTPTTTDNLTTAVRDMETAYTDAAGRAANYTELYTGDISGKTLTAGVYKWGTGVLINGDVTLNGGANDIWIFQVAKGITQADGTKIILTGGAQAKNIYWQSSETVAIKTGAHFEGIILGSTNITLGTQASINGRLLAQTAVTLDQSTVVAPSVAQTTY